MVLLACAGHVLAQEGDSFIVGFSEPLDAAVFALQVSGSCVWGWKVARHAWAAGETYAPQCIGSGEWCKMRI